MNDCQEPKKFKFIKIPQTKATIKRNIILAAGLLCIAAGIVLLILSFAIDWVFPLVPVLFLLAGLVLVFLCVGIANNALLLGFGIAIASWGVISLVSDVHVVPFTKSQLWPVEGIACAVGIFAAGLYHFRKIRSFFLFPSLTIAFLSVVFLLFSLDVIHVSLASFIGRWWPVLCIAVGIMLVVIFIYQKHNHKDFPYMEDDSTDITYSSSSEEDSN